MGSGDFSRVTKYIELRGQFTQAGNAAVDANGVPTGNTAVAEISVAGKPSQTVQANSRLGNSPEIVQQGFVSLPPNEQLIFKPLLSTAKEVSMPIEKLMEQGYLKKGDSVKMQHIEVPDFVGDEFNRPLTHPSTVPNAVSKSVERVYRLVSEALKGIDDGLGWEVGSRRYHSPITNEPYCFSQIEDKFYIWSEERGRKSPIAAFKSRHLAADYFVWLVFKGQREIDWSLFLDMEP